MMLTRLRLGVHPLISSFKRSASLPALILLGLAAAVGFATTRSTAEEARSIPAPAVDEQAAGKTSEVAVVAGGCFWGVQGVFQHVNGVTSAVSGYDGGQAATAHYEMTSNGDTGHAESVQITYDPRKISYGRILQIFFSVAHDPTELNRQGPDEGTQYRSAIFPQSDEQARVAKAYIAQLDSAHAYGAPIVTSIEPGKPFYRAEDYHQDFLARNPGYPYIVFNDLPKIASLKKLFPAVYRQDPVLVGIARS
jgi:peptide-methionine (S)-S-oxide reductase